MFVTAEQAQERLGSKTNIFRRDLKIEATAPHPFDVEEVIEQVDEEHVVVDPETVTEPAPRRESPKAKLTLQSLDDIIAPRIGRTFRGQTDTQVAIAETALILGPAAAGDIADLSTKQAAAYMDGLSSEADRQGNIQRNPARKARIDETRLKLADIAAARIEKTLNAMTDQMVAEITDAPTLAKVSKDLATVMDRCIPKDAAENQGVHFHIYRPEIKNPQHYDTVEVGSAVPTIDVTPSK